MDVTLIDVLPEFADGLRTVDPSMPNWELVHTFHQEHPTMFSFRDALVAAAWEWIGNVGADSRVHFYLAVEDEVVPECPVEEDEEADAEVPVLWVQLPTDLLLPQKERAKQRSQWSQRRRSRQWQVWQALWMA